jgi:hypothetical protein
MMAKPFDQGPCIHNNLSARKKPPSTTFHLH